MGTPRFRNGQQGQPSPAAHGLDGHVEMANRKAAAEMSNELFLAAQRRYELRLADKIEAELCGGLPPKAKAVVIETELAQAILTKHERELMAIANGAGIRTEPPMPTRADPMNSLIGCGTALL